MTETQVIVTIKNLAPEQGTFLTPVWVGFHNGDFDTYDRGRPASPGLESIAEDGDTTLISQEFALSGNGSVDGVVAGAEGLAEGPIDPGEVATATFTLESEDPNSQFFNYASMVLPSNDAFIANGESDAFRIFDGEGNFIGADFIVAGSQILDAGTEINDEAEANTAFFGQAAPNTGVEQNGLVQSHPGFAEGGRILSEDGSSLLAVAPFTNADFTQSDYQVARITVSTVEQPLPVDDPVAIISRLDGSQEVTGGDGNAQGTSLLTLNEQGNGLEYSLTVSGLDFGANGLVAGGAQTPDDTSDDVTRLHIHNADNGENGDVVFSLFDTVAPELGNELEIIGNQDEDLVVTLNENGSVTLTGVWEDTDSATTPLSDFVADIRDVEEGEDLDLYWNVHTEEFPDGAIRGQLEVAEVNSDSPEPDLVEVTVTIENLAPENGTLLTPVWAAFHDGTFDTYDRGRSSSLGLERLAEDGDASFLSREFISSGAGLVDGVIAGTEETPGPIDPGETTSLTFTLDRSLASSRFFNYASMVLPSNDAFIANGDGQTHEIFDVDGNFLGADFVVQGEEVLDAGTEANDEAENSTAFFGQTEPNTGTVENGVITLHPGFEADGQILSSEQFANGDFTADDYEVARITITAEGIEPEPEPPTALTLTGGTAQIAYVAYYGRPGDNGGLSFLNNALTEGEISYAPRVGDDLTGSERVIYDDLVNQFGNSEEAERLFGDISNRERVDRVYEFVFDREGDEEGATFWTEQINLGNVTLATFALEIALGAQNEDIITLNNKIQSADLFSNSIDTEPEIEAYQGSVGEVFGRTWLDDFGDTVSSQAQVDEALTDLVNG